MTSPRQREEVLNGKLGGLLIARHPAWTESNVHIDSTRTIRGSAASKIDLLVENPGGQPVAIETKFHAAGVGTALREQVEGRIGLQIDATGVAIESGVSVVYPTATTRATLENAKLLYAVHQLGDDDEVERWPPEDSEWCEGNVDDLADAVEMVSLSEKRIRLGEGLLANGVGDASARLEAAAQNETLEAIGGVLHQDGGEQTTRMAVAIVVNAFVFHYAIEGQQGIPDVDAGAGGAGFLKSRVTASWDAILKVNYWPIFSIAKALLAPVPSRLASPLLSKANEVAEQLLKVGATTFHDLAARMFQRLIADRKFLATFYTLPTSAALLAELAVSRLGVDWSDNDAVCSLKIADFACGTGTLLSAVQRAMCRRLRRAGIDDRDCHRDFMERVLLGTDIMPSAAHLTASMLSSAHPGTRYDKSLVGVLPYGLDEELAKRRREDSSTSYIGALDLRVDALGSSLFSQAGLGHRVDLGGSRMSARGERLAGDLPVEHGSFDLVIMNPPFTRPTGHEGNKVGVPVPSFAGFGTSEAEQQAMSGKLGDLDRQFGHGNAGLASEFMDLAHDKLKPGGTLALVLPFSFVSGRAWSKARAALSRSYKNITVVSIATAGSTARAFSADTGMAECLMLANRAERESKVSTPTVRYANLPLRPQSIIEAHEKSRIVERAAIKGTFNDSGAAGVLDPEVASIMIALQQGNLELPRDVQTHALPITVMGKVARRGLYHMDINGRDGRGAFDIKPRSKRRVPTYPVLWGHDAARERRLTVEPDTRGVVRQGMKSQAALKWDATASRLHHNVDFQLNSQSLAACLTREPCIGGTAWPNLLPLDETDTIPLLLWLNTTLGVALYWWRGTRQQTGRARIKITAVPDLPTLNTRQLKPRQRRRFNALFKEFESKDFLPANEAYRDPARKALDEAVLFDVLGLPPSLAENLDLLRLKWCAEPSVHGGKTTMPSTF